MTKAEIGMPEMLRPIGFAELVADQPVDGLRVGDAQERLGKAKERHPLLRGQRVFVQKRIDAAFADPVAADGGDEVARTLGNMAAGVGWDFGGGENARHRLGLVGPGAVADCRAQRRGRRQRAGKHDVHKRASSRPSAA